MRPRYCPCKYETPDPCPACGATVSGKDKVGGVCQATHGSEPVPLVELITVRKEILSLENVHGTYITPGEWMPLPFQDKGLN
jgi:hypothetical protein